MATQHRSADVPVTIWLNPTDDGFAVTVYLRPSTDYCKTLYRAVHLLESDALVDYDNQMRKWLGIV